MKSLLPLLIAALIAPALAGASGITVMVTRPWVPLRGTPTPSARAIALAYGNDTFPLVQRREEWVQVRWKGGRTVWLPGDAVEAEPADRPGLATRGQELARPALPVQLPGPLDIPAMRLAEARVKQSAGFRREAREKYLAILAHFPGTPQFYEAIRQMGFYHRVARLAPLDGPEPGPQRMAQAEARLGPLLLEEGRTLRQEGRDLDAVAVYEMAILGAPSARQRAEEGLREALGAYLGRVRGKADPRELKLMEATFRDYFPGQPLPRTADGEEKPPRLAARPVGNEGR